MLESQTAENAVYNSKDDDNTPYRIMYKNDNSPFQMIQEYYSK